MKITLKKKHDSSDKTGMVVLMKKPRYFCQHVDFGGSLEVPEDLGYAILGDARYTGMFKQEVGGYAETKSATATQVVTSKSMKAKANKSSSVPEAG